MTAFQLLLGGLTLLTNAFFVGAEFALISVRRSQIEPLADAGDRRARTVLSALEHLSPMMATAQFGITLSTVVLGAVAEPAIAHLLEPGFEAVGVPHGLVHPISFVIALTLATYLHMLVGEMVPKNIALAAPATTALWLAPPLVAITRVLRPLIFSINALANGILRLMGVQARDEVESAFDSTQLAHMLKDSQAAGLLDPREQERLEDALALGRRPVTEVLLSTDHTVTVPVDVTAERLEELAVATGFSRFPVVGEGGAILGYLHVKDALDAEDRAAPIARSVWRPVISVPAATPLDDALAAMRRGASHLAAVVDDADHTLGLVTMEDVLEELVGEVNDPAHQAAPPVGV
ncbi:hemolysin family protein [Allostreptomyces psammosilenae]|uniref:CBS domain containing-hemolysin-like protein n=1 Tax=Allostreptomyces psammosilenae TaxID=1892865 RepID=A0A852ZS21_9ACTN|nr:hemolysin family protein [Allostreptomyces psammosilenae]NYI04257.1 CBS domain containing-hemolysin-like protein [Allostreptomyces psammosilenae]